jgi:Tol biopolymer transport system component
LSPSKPRLPFKTTFACVLLIAALAGQAWGFGQSRIRDVNIKWRVYQTDHFDIYYDKNTEFLLERSIQIAEDAYDHISSILDFDIPGRTPLMIYGSRRAFEQTNISNTPPSEGTGGFSEILRHRVVVPYEGSQTLFDHVLTHEITHVFTFQMFFSSPGALFYNQVAYPAMWFMEGLPEFVAGVWEPEGEMALRDGVINDQLAPLQDLQDFYDPYHTFLYYQEGHSALDYLAETYGEEAIRNLLRNLKRDPQKDMNKALKKTIDKSLIDFNDDWMMWLKRKYLPGIAVKQAAREFARPLIKDPTDQQRLATFIAPEWSPSGDLIAVIGTTSFFPNIFLYSADDGKKVANLTSGYYLDRYLYLVASGRPMAYSPDNDHLAWVARVGTRDRIIYYDLVRRTIKRRILLDLEDINEISFDPTGKRLAVIGMKGSSRDLYVYDLAGKKLTRITQSPFNKTSPAWSPDGEWIAYSEETEGASRIVIIRPDGTTPRILVEDDGENKSPSWSPDSKKIAYAGSYHDKTPNLCMVDVETDEAARYTDFLVGLDQIRWSPTGERLMFTAFESNHEQVFVLDIPKEGFTALDSFPGYRPRKKEEAAKEWEEETTDTGETKTSFQVETTTDAATTDAAVAPGTTSDKKAVSGGEKTTSAATVAESSNGEKLPGVPSSGQPGEGSFIQPLTTPESVARNSRPYSIKFEADYAASSFVYTTGGAFQNYTQVSLSDMLSNHEMDFLADLTSIYNVNDINGAYYYEYRGDYPTYGALLSSWRYLYYSPHGYFWERNSGGEFQYTYPLNRTNKFGIDPYWYARRREWLKYKTGSSSFIHVIEDKYLTGGVLSFTHDTAQWGYFHPTHGERIDLSVQQAVPAANDYLSFTNFNLDARKYLRLTQRGSFAFRLMGGSSQGRDPQDYYLGGGFDLRGYPYYSFYGNQMALFNFETRFPLVDAIFFPLEGLAFGYFRSLLFLDWGAAWNKDGTISWDRAKTDEAFQDFTPWTSRGGFHLVHSKMAFGTGIRWYIGLADFRLDWAWHTDLRTVAPEPYVHVSLGNEW